MRALGSQWISNKMNIRHPGQLKKWKSWEPFWSYQLNSTANPAHLPQNWAKFEVNRLDWQSCLAGSSKMAPRILIFSIVIRLFIWGKKNIEIWVLAFFKHNNSFVATVGFVRYFSCACTCLSVTIAPFTKIFNDTITTTSFAATSGFPLCFSSTGDYDNSAIGV